MSGWFGWANAVAFSVGSQSVKWADLLGNVAALGTVALAIRRHLLTWPVQIIGSILLFGASVDAHLGGNAARQVVLGLMAAYGWWRWLRGIKIQSEVPVRFATMRERAVILILLGAGTAAFAFVLDVFNASWDPIPDAYIFIGSVVATLAQARGWVEFWIVWMLVDVVGVPLAWSHGLVVSGAVYGAFFVMTVLGFRDWAIKSRSTRELQVQTS